MSPHLSQFALEALVSGALGELPESERTAVSDHVALCDECRQRVDVARAAVIKFDREIFPRTHQSIEARIGWQRRWLAALLGLVPALGLAAIFMMSRPAEIGFKGGVSLRVLAQRDQRVFEVREGEALSQGDRVRFEIEPGGLPYLMVVGIDAEGNSQVYVPYEGSESLSVDPIRRFVSPGSIELDAARGPERVFVLSSRQPLSARAVQTALEPLRDAAAIRTTAKLPVPADAQTSFLWEKGGL